MTGVYIGKAKRTPIGKLNGNLSSLSAVELGCAVLSDLIAESEVDPEAFDEVIIGQVLTGGAGQNPSRQSALRSGLPEKVPALMVNQVCAAGMRSVHLAAQAIQCGDAALVATGGQDSMSRAPHLLYDSRTPCRPGNRVLRDSMIVDGLWDAFHDVHMGVTAEHLATRFKITREEQDEFALSSHAKAVAAWCDGRFETQVTPVTVTTVRDEIEIRSDESPRDGLTLEQLARMDPVFDPDGSITAGNASGLNDGAAMMIVGSERALQEQNIEPIAHIKSYASAALAPMDMGLGPVLATSKVLAGAGWHLDDIDVFELNEAFAAQAIAVIRELGCDPDRVNLSGGAIALGHPLAGSGARIVVALIHEMIRIGARRGLASLCVGGGQATAICLEL